MSVSLLTLALVAAACRLSFWAGARFERRRVRREVDRLEAEMLARLTP